MPQIRQGDAPGVKIWKKNCDELSWLSVTLKFTADDTISKKGFALRYSLRSRPHNSLN